MLKLYGVALYSNAVEWKITNKKVTERKVAAVVYLNKERRVSTAVPSYTGCNQILLV